jgi:hypothetical protein
MTARVRAPSPSAASAACSSKFARSLPVAFAASSHAITESVGQSPAA